jgi:hypothetical protein
MEQKKTVVAITGYNTVSALNGVAQLKRRMRYRLNKLEYHNTNIYIYIQNENKKSEIPPHRNEFFFGEKK